MTQRKENEQWTVKGCLTAGMRQGPQRACRQKHTLPFVTPTKRLRTKTNTEAEQLCVGLGTDQLVSNIHSWSYTCTEHSCTTQTPPPYCTCSDLSDCWLCLGHAKFNSSISGFSILVLVCLLCWGISSPSSCSDPLTAAPSAHILFCINT